jgi:branched-chain amino acid transport system substrate-binding protein
MKSRIFLATCIAISLMIISFGSCTKKDNGVLKVGVILPLTGRLSVMGQVEKNAMSLALEKANAGGRKIELQIEDGKGNPADAVSAARKLLDVDKVDILLTSTTGASLAVEPIATQSKKNLVAFCMDPDVAKKSDYVLRYYEGIDEESAGITQYFGQNTTAKSVGILYAKIPVWEKVVNNTLLPFLKSKNIPAPFVESYALNDSDFKTVVLKMKEAKLDHLILLGYGFEYPNIFKSLAEYGLIGNIQLVGGWGFLYTDVDPKLLEGSLVSGPEYVFKKQEFAGQFYNDYFSRYQKYPNFDAAFAYNAVMSLAENVSKEDTNQPIKGIFAKKGELKGVAGPYTISPQGNMIVGTSLGRYRDGTIIALGGDQK